MRRGGSAGIRQDQRFLNLSGQFGLPPPLRNLVKPTSIYRALVGRLSLTRKPRGSLTLTVLLLVRRAATFPSLLYEVLQTFAADCLGATRVAAAKRDEAPRN